MKKSMAILLFALFALPATALAVSTNANQGTVTSSPNSTATSTSTQAATETRTQTQTNNPGTGVQTQTRTEEQVQTQTQEDIASTKQQYQAKSASAGSRSSEVAKAVQNMLEVANRTNDPGIGDQIRNIAREQNQAEDKANQAMDRIQERSSVAKFFIGANYSQMKEIKQIMEQNQERIRELQQIMTQLSNSADQTELQNQISVLEIQNLNLSNQLQDEGKGFSLIGWAIRWFYGV